MKKNEKVDAEDACPFPPGIDPPRRGSLGTILNSSVVDWRILAPVLSLGLILLVSGLLITPPIPFTPFKEPKTWNSTIPQYQVSYFPQLSGWTSMYPKQVVHQGDLTLGGSEEYLIENCTYILNGELHASGNSSLVLRNSEVWVKGHSSHPPWIDLNFTDTSKLLMYNSKIVCPILGYGCTVILLDDSTADIRYSNVTFVDLNGDGRSRVQIDHSSAGAIYVASNASCSIKNSEVAIVGPGGLIGGQDPSFPLMNTMGRVFPWVNTRIEILNSSLGTLLLRTIDSRVVVNGSITKDARWNPSKFCTGGVWSNISMVDSNVDKVLLWVDNSTLELSNNNELTDLVVTGGSAKLSNVSMPSLTLENCTGSIDRSIFTGLGVYRNSLVSVKDSHTEILDLSDFNGRLLCDFMSVSRLYGYNVNATLTGSLRINDPHLISWPVLQQQSRLKREYSVAAVSEDVFAQGVKLSLMNGNRTLWSGTTDSSGKSYFNVTYYHIWRLGMGVWADDNSTLTLTLTAKLGDEMHVSNVTVETSSPIVFSFDKQPEPPIWGNRYTLLVAGGIIITATLVFYFSKIRRRVVSLH